MKTVILRDTNSSFVITTTKHGDQTFSRKIEKGSTEYGNACHDFHMNNVAIEIGNKLTK